MSYLIKTLYVLALVDLIAAEASLPITLIGCESKPQCGHVLVDNMDNITCYAKINNLTDLTDYKVRFFLKRKGYSLYVQRCQLDLIDGCIEKRDRLCYCREQNEVVFNFVVLLGDSEAEITASLKKGKEKEIFSEIYTAPRIIQAPKIESLQLLVKNMEVKNETIIRVSNDDKKLPLTLSSNDEEALQMFSLHYDQDLNTDSAISLKPETMTIKIKMCEKEILRYILNILYEDDPKQTSPNISECSTKTTPKEDDPKQTSPNISECSTKTTPKEDDLKQTSPNISECSTKTTPKDADQSDKIIMGVFIGLFVLVSLILIAFVLLTKFKKGTRKHPEPDIEMRNLNQELEKNIKDLRDQ